MILESIYPDSEHAPVGVLIHGPPEISEYRELNRLTKTTLSIAAMARSTRSTYYPSTPTRSEKRCEASTRTRTRFFDALDRSGGRK